MKTQSSQWKSPGSPHLKKVQQNLSKIKTMLTVFFVQEGVVPHEYVPPGQTVDKECYLDILRWLRDCYNPLHLQATGDWQFHHDSVLTHVSHLVQSFLAKHQITQVTEPPLHPRFWALWFLAFPKTKITFERKEISDY